MTLSVCLIVRDEQEVIGRCLNCVCKFADEIIVVDTGSTDGTVEEARKFTEDIFFFKWCDDFSAARNFAFENATCDYVMWLDADDVVTDENCRKIKRLLEENAGFDMAFLPYVSTVENDEPTFVYYRERIFKRSKNFKFAGAVHEAVVPQGNIVYSDAEIHHKKVKENAPLRNLKIYQNLIASGKTLDARSQFYYGRELIFNKMYREGIAVLENFLVGDGWIENKKEACLNLYYAYSAIGCDDLALSSVLKSLTYAVPESQTCCILGEKFLNDCDYKTAEFWYKTALRQAPDEKSGAFINADFCGFIPYMQLCVICDRLGKTEEACAYNEMAGKIKPYNANYLSNKKYFSKKLGKEV